MALIYLVAFISLWTQVEGLYGPGGISPLGTTMDYWQLKLGKTPFWSKPSFLWWNLTDYDHHILLGIGVMFSILMLIGTVPLVSAFMCWFSYLSFVSLGRNFMSFQWDLLLLEAGFITLFLHPKAFARFIIWPYRFLLFRLIFASGLVKITSGDIHWESLKALDYHYLTQPLPNFISWFIYHASPWFHRISVIVMFAVELACPFFIFFSRRFRLFAFYAFLFFQLAIIITGNYGFFNWLTIVLCFCLVDDQHWRWYFNTKNPMIPRMSQVRILVGLLFMLYTLVMGSIQLLNKKFPKEIRPIARLNSNFRLVNRYGLFAVMTTRRNEIHLQGSFDDEVWKSYTFKYKPNGVKDRPKWLFFHMPRLDWQMWFAALRSKPPYWFQRLAQRLLRGDENIAGLFAENPFPGRPPRYIRALIYNYRFSTIDKLFDEGKWWQRTYRGLYLDSVSKW